MMYVIRYVACYLHSTAQGDVKEVEKSNKACWVLGLKLQETFLIQKKVNICIHQNLNYSGIL